VEIRLPLGEAAASDDDGGVVPEVISVGMLHIYEDEEVQEAVERFLLQHANSVHDNLNTPWAHR
jgi:hypothetical protein